MKNTLFAVLALLLAHPARATDAGAATSPVIIKELLIDFLHNNSDPARHENFWADDLIYTTSGAVVKTKAEIMKSFDEDKTVPAKQKEPSATYAAEDIVVRPYGSTAALTFRLVAHNPDGTNAYYRNSGTLIFRDGHWQVVTWQATKVPPPEKK